MEPNRRAFAFIALALAALLACSCSFFGWKDEARISLNLVGPTQTAPAGGRALSGAYGDLQLPDFVSYDVTVTGPDMDPIVKTGLSGAASVSVPVGTGRVFTVLGRTAQASFSGASAATTVSGAATISVTMALTDIDLFVPALVSTTGRLYRVTYASGGTPLSVSDNLASALRDYAGAAYTGDYALPSPFEAGDAAVDAEGFVYLSEQTDWGAAKPAIFKIRDADGGASLESDVVYHGECAVDSAAALGVTSIAVDSANGYLYFCRKGEAWFYRKSLALENAGGTEDYRKTAQRVPLDGGATIIALDCAADGSVYVLYANGGSYYITQYTSITPGSTPSDAQAVGSVASLPLDVQVKGGYAYVLTATSGSIVVRYSASSLVATPSQGGAMASSATTSGQFANASRFLTGPAGTIFVKVAPSGAVGVVSFTDLSWTGWSYQGL